MITRFTLFLLLLLNCGNAIANLDSLLAVVESQKLDNNMNELLATKYSIGNKYISADQFAKAFPYFEEVLQVAQKNHLKLFISKAYYGMAMSHQRRNNYQEALMFYTKLISNESSGAGSKMKAKAFSQISYIYQTLGDYDQAFEMQMQALELHEAAGDKKMIAESNYILATNFFYQDQFDQALIYYTKAYDLCVELKQERIIYSCLSALGSVHDMLDHDTQSLHYNTESLVLAEKLNYKTGIAYAYGNMATNYAKKEDWTKAEDLYLKSIEIKKELGDQLGTSGSSIGLANIYLDQNKTKEAIPLLQNALQLALKLKTRPRKLEVYELMARAYSMTEEMDKAHNYLKDYIALKDSILNEKTVEEMGKSKRRYEVHKKEQEIILLTTENELLGKNKKIQRMRTYGLAGALLLVIAFLAMFHNRHKMQSQLNQLLLDKNELLNAKNDEIRIKNNLLKQSNQDLTSFAYVASHDLKEPLRMIKSYTQILQRRYNDLLDDSGREFMFFVTDAVDRMETLLDDLLEFSRSTPKKDIPKTMINLNDVMFLVESNLRGRLEDSNGRLIIKNENLPIIKSNRSQLVQLLQNLVSNAVKFRGERDPIVTVDCKMEKNRYVISVSDNGIGISNENKQKVFEMFRRLHTREEYSGTGIGLATCKRIVNHLGGEIWVESELGKGSTFFFSIPAKVEELVAV